MALNDVFEARISGLVGSSQEWNSVFHYQCIDVGVDEGEAEDLENTLTSALIPLIRAGLSSANRNVNNIFVQNLSNLSDWHASTLTLQGQLEGDPLPSVLAIGFRSPKQSPGYNRARHNFPLGVTTWIDSTGFLDVDLADNILYPLQQQLGLPLTSAGGSGFNPVTVAKSYSQGVFVSASVQSVVTGQWSVNTAFTTMKSRQDFLWGIIDEPA